jgi:hypothetical protein
MEIIRVCVDRITDTCEYVIEFFIKTLTNWGYETQIHIDHAEQKDKNSWDTRCSFVAHFSPMSVATIYSAELQDDRGILNWEGFGRKRF